eukprot:maker-scaffold329_size204955-snap-gene-0.14 protein:Tk00265 transcript:maker-scaffold329_size204955-snap-gene-0.14-mRNA-1 annotation:"isoform d"
MGGGGQSCVIQTNWFQARRDIVLTTTMVVVIMGLVVPMEQVWGDQESNGTLTIDEEEAVNPEPKLNKIPCDEEVDCDSADGAYCDLGTHLCTCKPDFEVTDTKNCYKESNYDEFCRMDVQCQRTDLHMRCNLDLNLCQCQPRFMPKLMATGGGKKKKSKCVEDKSKLDMTPGSFYDPALFGIMGGLALMFVVMCVVLQLFAKAQFQENRTIFNTPNPRLMNVSLMKDSKLFGTPKSSGSSNSLSAAQKRKLRKESLAAAAAAAAALQIGQTPLEGGDGGAGEGQAGPSPTVPDLEPDGEENVSLLSENMPNSSHTEPKDRKSSGNTASHDEAREHRKRGSAIYSGGAGASAAQGAGTSSSHLGNVAEEEKIQIESET